MDGALQGPLRGDGGTASTGHVAWARQRRATEPLSIRRSLAPAAGAHHEQVPGTVRRRHEDSARLAVQRQTAHGYPGRIPAEGLLEGLLQFGAGQPLPFLERRRGQAPAAGDTAAGRVQASTATRRASRRRASATARCRAVRLFSDPLTPTTTRAGSAMVIRFLRGGRDGLLDGNARTRPPLPPLTRLSRGARRL